MLHSPKYIQNTFAVNFPRYSLIRRKANEFEDKLKGLYLQPQVISVPDELNPEIPRIIFNSEHGFSQVVVSQMSIVLNVVYSPEWQMDIGRGRSYLHERVSVVFDLLGVLDGIQANFSGLTTRARIASNTDDQAIISYLSKTFLRSAAVGQMYEVQIKQTVVTDGHFFNNIVVQNYRSWFAQTVQREPSRMPFDTADERGIEIIGDFNDRYKFNESGVYQSSLHVAEKSINSGLDEVGQAIAKAIQVTK